MPLILSLVFALSTVAAPPTAPTPANPPASSCGQVESDWMTCKATSDCVLVEDTCGRKRVPVNKTHAGQMEKIMKCQGKSVTCPTADDADSSAMLKCDSYLTIAGSGENAAPMFCMPLVAVIDLAINKGDRAKLESVLAEAKDMDLPMGPNQETPLMVAALGAKTALVRFLLEKGAKVNAQAKNGMTALMFASQGRPSDAKDLEETIKALLGAGADKKLRNQKGENALDISKATKNAAATKALQ